jgi:hypothetical protein
MSAPTTPRYRVRASRDNLAAYRRPVEQTAWELCVSRCESIITKKIESTSLFKFKRNNVGNVRLVYESKDSVDTAREVVELLQQTLQLYCTFSINPTGKEDYPYEIEFVIFEQSMTTDLRVDHTFIIVTIILLILFVFAALCQSFYHLYLSKQ